MAYQARVAWESAAKVAVIDVSALRVIEQAAGPLHDPPPLQPVNVELIAELGVAVSVMLVPLANVAFCVVQVVLQLMPAGLEVMVPASAADLVMVRV